MDGSVGVVQVSTPEFSAPEGAEFRRFRWDGQSFRAVEGPYVGFDLGRGPTRYAVSVVTTPLTADPSGGRSATMTVTVSNRGTLASHAIELEFFAESAVTSVFDHEGSPLVRQDISGSRHWSVLIEPVPTGATVTGLFTLQVAGDDLTQLSRSVPMTVLVTGHDAAAFPQSAEDGYEHLRSATFGLMSS
jgi:hypothetical protein